MNREKILRGIPVSKGVGIGTAFQYQRPQIQVFQTPILSIYLNDERQRFERALVQTKRELTGIKTRINKEIGADFAQFLDAQLLMLEDPALVQAVRDGIENEKKNAEYIYHRVIGDYARRLSDSQDPYLRERSADIWDVGNRVLKNLLGMSHASVLEVPPETVVIAHDISPSEASLMNPEHIVGIAMEIGGRTSHTAITARALNIPAVLGVENVTAKIGNGDPVLIDGGRGIVIKNPTQSRRSFYVNMRKKAEQTEKALSPYCVLEPETKDGKHVDISANIEFFAEARQALKYGAWGIGLFRTEFMYLTRRGSPSEEEQYRVYYALAKKMRPHPVIIRTFDLGGDKIFSDYHEANPFLGWRAIRVCLQQQDFFKTQLRAILRASVFHNVRVMFPMISTYEEVARTKLIIDAVKQDLRKENIDFDAEIPIGIMVETPSAALLGDSLARELSFFSIGSNDLTQYTLAVDRGNERVSQLFDHFHPAVLRLIAEVSTAGHRNHIWVGLCGELASDPIAIPLLVGLGLDELSMSPSAIPRAKMVLRALDVPTCQQIAAKALTFRTALEVKRYLRNALSKVAPGNEEELS